jgi:hypothetical protein
MASASSDKNAVCAVSDFVVAASPLCEGELLEMSFTFTGTDFGANGYMIMDDEGVLYGPFYSGDPMVFYEFAICSDYEIYTIYDVNNPSCSKSFTYGFVCCPCEWTVSIQQGQCEPGGVHDAFFTINTESGSCTNYDPTLTVNGVSYPLVYLNNNIYKANNISSTDAILTYTIHTSVPNLPESQSFDLPNPCLGELTDFDVVINTDFCIDDGLINVPFTFSGQNFGIGQNMLSITTF